MIDLDILVYILLFVTIGLIVVFSYMHKKISETLNNIEHEHNKNKDHIEKIDKQNFYLELQLYKLENQNRNKYRYENYLKHAENNKNGYSEFEVTVNLKNGEEVKIKLEDHKNIEYIRHDINNDINEKYNSNLTLRSKEIIKIIPKNNIASVDIKEIDNGRRN